MISYNNLEIDMKNNKLEVFLEEELGNNIQLSLLECKNKSQVIYSPSVSVNDVINKLRLLNCVKATTEHIRKVLLNVDLDLEDNFEMHWN